jgi:hypothetical protein
MQNVHDVPLLGFLITCVQPTLPELRDLVIGIGICLYIYPKAEGLAFD